MIEKTYVLTIPDLPKSVNTGGGGARAHHMVAHKEKKRWEGRFLMELLAAQTRKRMQFCTIDITVRWRRRNRRDVENYRHPILKPLLDALVKGGYLEDDTDEWVHVRDVTFEYPDTWPYADPRSSAELVITLEGSYL